MAVDPKDQTAQLASKSPKEPKPKPRLEFADWAPLASVALAVPAFALFGIWWILNDPLGGFALNELGDSFAPLGVLMSAAALFYVYRGMMKQSEELRLQRQELKLARKEQAAQRKVAKKANRLAKERRVLEEEALAAQKKANELEEKALAAQQKANALAAFSAWSQGWANGSTIVNANGNDEESLLIVLEQAKRLAEHAGLPPLLPWSMVEDNFASINRQLASVEDYEDVKPAREMVRRRREQLLTWYGDYRMLPVMEQEEHDLRRRNQEYVAEERARSRL